MHDSVSQFFSYEHRERKKIIRDPYLVAKKSYILKSYMKLTFLQYTNYITVFGQGFFSNINNCLICCSPFIGLFISYHGSVTKLQPYICYMRNSNKYFMYLMHIINV